MAIARPGYQEEVGGEPRNLLLTNIELDRFEVQYAPFGVFGLFDQLMGRGAAPQVRHVRDIVALGLVGGGMGDKAADALIASLPPSENFALRGVAQRLLGATFMPEILRPGAVPGKKPAGSRRAGAPASGPTTGITPEPKSPTSVA